METRSRSRASTLTAAVLVAALLVAPRIARSDDEARKFKATPVTNDQGKIVYWDCHGDCPAKTECCVIYAE